MSDPIRAQIYETLNLKETDELRSIWIANNRAEYTDQAFDVIQEILGQRLEEIPLQNEPGTSEVNGRMDVLEQTPGQPVPEANAPAFYNPDYVMKISTWLPRIAIASIIITGIMWLMAMPSLQRDIASLWAQNNVPVAEWVSWMISIIGLGLGLAVQCFMTYYGLRALASILMILMEMEFNSRKA